MRPLSLHHTTVIDVTPFQLVSLAAQAQCQGVCLFVHSPNPRLTFPLVDASDVAALRTHLDDSGIAVTNVEYLYVDETFSAEAIKPAAAIGAALGAKRFVVHVHDPEVERAAANFAILCDLLADHGMFGCIEFYGLARGCNSLASSVRVLELAARANSGVAIDCLHVIRTGSTAEDVAAIDPRWLGYGQLCDGALQCPREAWMDELKNGRMLPGTGELPLVDLLQAVPQDLPFDVEVPRNRAGDHAIPAAERVRAAVAASRAVLAAAGRG